MSSCCVFQIEGKPGTVGGEGVLQNFFNSLLNRRTGSPIGGPLASVRTPGGKFSSFKPQKFFK